MKRITKGECREWAARFAKSTTAHTRHNNTLAALRHIFAHAVEAGARFSNPADALKRKKEKPSQLVLPSREQSPKLVEAIATAGAWCSRDCADLVAFLAYTGLRKSEAAAVTCADVNFEKGQLTVRGDYDTATKNWTIRHVPLISDALALLRRLRAGRADEPTTERVLRVQEAQKALDRACRKVGVARIKHHDLRHLYATACIEAGVDIPTVSRWLGHKDGGALAMKTHGHLRDDHSQREAQRVTFGTPKPANVVSMTEAAV